MKEFKSLMTETGKAKFYVFTELCKGCGLCIEKCPKNDIGWSDVVGIYGSPIVEAGKGEGCTACKTCQNICPECAIRVDKAE